MEELICKICGRICFNYGSLSTHIRWHHKEISSKDYYDTYLKKDKNEHLCNICSKPINYINIRKGYNQVCSNFECRVISAKKCKLEKYGDANFNNRAGAKVTCLERYGVDSINKVESIKQLKKDLCMEKYGVENISQIEEVKLLKKKTCKINYGVEIPLQSPLIMERRVNTCLDKYGVEHNSQIEGRAERMEIKSLAKYGVRHPTQTKDYQDSKKEYYLEKYGVESVSQLPWVQKKSQDTCLERYGIKYPFLLYSGFSKVSQELFWKIYEQLPKELQQECNFAELNKERFLNFNGKYLLYDFCLLSKKIFIEFQGDYWHRNPNLYEATEENIAIWEKDRIKKDVAEENGFQVFYIWESDYNNDKEKIVNYFLNLLLLTN